MNPIILIPCRMASTRLPNKPLADIAGKPMIVRVWDIAKHANLGPVVVACDDQRIKDVIDQAGGLSVLTDPDLPSGSDRIWDALQQIDPQGRHDVVVNLQGDLPNVSPGLLQALLEPLADASIDLSTLGVPFKDKTERADPNQVKIVFSPSHNPKRGKALYFTRADAPHGAPTSYYHIGLYAYRRQALEKYVSLPVSTLEKAERLEQLRALEADMKIGVSIVDEKPIGVDTPDDLARVTRALEKTTEKASL